MVLMLSGWSNLDDDWGYHDLGNLSMTFDGFIDQSITRRALPVFRAFVMFTGGDRGLTIDEPHFFLL